MRLRAEAAALRHCIYMRMQWDHLMNPTSNRAWQEQLTAREWAFVPAFYWTPVWTDEARRAFYGLPRR